MDLESLLKSNIREVPDFPIKGVNFKDISPIFLQPDLIRQTAEALAAPWKGKGIIRVVASKAADFFSVRRLHKFLVQDS